MPTSQAPSPTSRQRPRSTRGWGGARAGAGRPRTRAIASEPHKPRPPLAARHPVHVTARVLPAVFPLRRRDAHAALRRALRRSLARADFRIVRVAIRGARIELVVEADDKLALARGMQGFQVAAARRLNAALRRHGTVFPDRYRAAILRTRAAVRAALATLGAHASLAPSSPPEPRAWPATWLLRVELGRLPPRPG
jgi:hypothetical protein